MKAKLSEGYKIPNLKFQLASEKENGLPNSTIASSFFSLIEARPLLLTDAPAFTQVESVNLTPSERSSSALILQHSNSNSAVLMIPSISFHIS
jgi:hypothetical protein